MQVRVARLGHVGLTVRNIDRTVEFYGKYLGMQLTEKFEYENRDGHGVAVQSGAFIRCAETHHELSLFKMRSELLPEDSSETPMYSFGLHHVAFEMTSPGDLKDLYVKMRDDGVTIVNCRMGGPGNQPRFYARDPDGNLLEFYWGIDKIGWNGVSRPYDPIAEIDILTFDFDAFVAKREKDAADARPKLSVTTRHECLEKELAS